MPATAEKPRSNAAAGPSSVEALGAEITELCTYIYAATYRLLVLIRQFDEAEGWAGPGLWSCAHWLNFKCGIGMNAAREKVRVAHALKDLPKISERFEKGELSYSKVRAMTRIANEDNEDFLLRIARHGTAYHMEKLVQKFRRAKTAAGHRTRQPATSRSLPRVSLRRGWLPGAVGALARRAGCDDRQGTGEGRRC